MQLQPVPPATVCVRVRCAIAVIFGLLRLLDADGRGGGGGGQSRHEALIPWPRWYVGRGILHRMAAPVGDVCVGRARELDVLERALAAARTRTGAVASIAGEAGIGKTRLAMELGRTRGDDGFDVLFGRSIDLIGTELPYQPFVEALRPLGALPRTAQSRLQVFETALALLTGRAATVPVLLVLDDLHWADTSTLDLLVFLAHHLAAIGCSCS